MTAPTYWTAEMVRAVPDDGKRYEVVYGELLVTPAPRAWHQEIVGRLFLEIGNYLRRNRVAHLLASPAEIAWSDDTLVQPDLFVLPLEQARTLDWTRMKDLLLVIEVLSPSSARADRFTKRRLYQEQRVPLYWIVDGDAHEVEVWTPERSLPGTERARVVWHPAHAAEPLIVELEQLFRPI